MDANISVVNKYGHPVPPPPTLADPRSIKHRYTVFINKRNACICYRSRKQKGKSLKKNSSKESIEIHTPENELVQMTGDGSNASEFYSSIPLSLSLALVKFFIIFLCTQKTFFVRAFECVWLEIVEEKYKTASNSVELCQHHLN